MTGVRRVDGASGNQDFLVATDTAELVLKASALQDFAPGAWACERARRAGVRTPEVLALEPRASTLPLPFLLLRAVPGEPATVAAPVLVELGRQLARLHSIDVAGFGELSVVGDTAHGVDPTWTAAVTRLTAGIEELTRASILRPSAADRVLELVQDADVTDFAGPAVLLHTDLKLEHVLVGADGGLGIIDWDDAIAGDPLLDLGRLSIAGPAVLEPVLEGYGVRPDARLARLLALYRLAWTIDSLTYELRAGGSRFEPGVVQVEADLAVLG